MNERDILVCALWEEHVGLIPSEKKACEKCGVSIAIDAKNCPIAAAKRLELRCLACSLPELMPQLQEGKFLGLISGEFVTGVNNFRKAVFERIKRRIG